MPPPECAERFASPADVAHCRHLLRDGSRTFFAASLILPAGLRAPSAGLYAFCRVADDAVDRGLDGAAALSRMRARLESVYRGQPHDHPVDRVFADTVARGAIPVVIPRALLEGFAWDVERRRYETLAELECYAVRVAGTVGLMMALLMGVRDRTTLAAACDLGVAMQLTNVARDVGEDACNGRLYLPLAWLREEGIDPDLWLARPAHTQALARVVERLLGVADALYAGAEPGIGALPASCRPGMRAARLLYAEIGREVARRGFNSIDQRAVVSWQRKARILADAMVGRAPRPPLPARVPRPESLFLIDCAAGCDAAPPAPPLESTRERLRWPRIEDRITWLIDLFERLERSERARLGAVDP
jgi:15-cis-phytoene synthase